MTDKFSVNGAYSYNLETDQRAASRVGFIYDSQCWTLYASYLNRPNDWAFSFTIELLGLGKFRY
ncbi:MAG: hypothetical protein PVF30_12570, partial [Desulfobacterales bacterium]|jgi:lipopolysaccharide assembly outer membrane protein LptD (OstA)